MILEFNKRCKNLRIATVYSISNQTYLLRLKATTNDVKEEDEGLSKNFLLLESSCLLHLTKYDYSEEATSNQF